ncbi:hypothetical protein GEMRC1_004388 [Eukaryota sp. GEM-RC1]
MSLTLLSQLESHSDRIWSVAFSPDGNSLLSSSADCSVNIYSFANHTLSLQKTIHEHSRAVRRVAWRNDSCAFVSASFDKSMAFFYLDDSIFKMERIEGHECEVKCAKFSSRGQLASCSRDRLVWVWEYDSMCDDFEVVSVLHGHEQDVKCVAWHLSGQLLASGSYDNTVRLWRDDDGLFVEDKVLTGHSDTIWALCFSPCGEFLFSSGGDNVLITWGREGSDWKKISEFKLPSRHTTYELDYNAKHSMLAVASGDHSLSLIDVSDATSPCVLCHLENAHGSDVNTVSWHPSELIVASGDDIGLLRLWKVGI